jgi:hypothetical protein
MHRLDIESVTAVPMDTLLPNPDKPRMKKRKKRKIKSSNIYYTFSAAQGALVVTILIIQMKIVCHALVTNGTNQVAFPSLLLSYLSPRPHSFRFAIIYFYRFSHISLSSVSLISSARNF